MRNLVWIIPGARSRKRTEVERVAAEVIDETVDCVKCVVDVGERTQYITR